MDRLKSALSFISHIGVDPQTTSIKRKGVILSNKISLLLIPLSIGGLMISYSGTVYSTSIGFALLIVFLHSVFLLNHLNKSLIARFGLAVLPQFFLLLPNVLSGIGKAENYLAFSYIFIGFVVIPLLLFHDRKNFGILAIALLFNLLFVLFFDVFLVWSEHSRIDLQLIKQNYVYYKIPQVILWLLMVFTFQYLKSENISLEKRLFKANDSVLEHNEEIRTLNEKLTAQNDALNEYKINLEKQKNRLIDRNNELQNTKLELLKTIEKLQEAKEKLLEKRAEVKSIMSALNEYYLVAQYDLKGELENVNTKAIDLLGVIQDKQFRQIKPIKANREENKLINGQMFKNVWTKILKGEAQTVELNYQVNGRTLCLATTFAPLFNNENNPYKILAVGHDVTELKEKNEKIDKINEEMQVKIFEISQQNELLNFQQSEIFDKSEKLHEQKKEIQAINESLEQRVRQRTKFLEDKNRQLTEYALINPRVLRSPVSTILGLINLINYSSLSKKEKEVYEQLKETANALDNVVKNIHDATDDGGDFDRSYNDPGRNLQQ